MDQSDLESEIEAMKAIHGSNFEVCYSEVKMAWKNTTNTETTYKLKVDSDQQNIKEFVNATIIFKFNLLYHISV